MQVRLLTVVFLDLVGFTTFSEGRNPEDLRDLLDRYFTRSRRIIERYGGSVAKFIGDAVLAVWGSPVAHDDDAARAVRAALDLVAEVTALGEDEGLTGLSARSGITTGRVAVTVGAEHEGMVVGDRVNTASRIQGAAPPGAVLVDDATKRATSATISYEEAGTHDLKGKDEQVRMWRATRIVARRGGTIRAQGLEPPFVGRERELRLVKDVFEAVADQETARMTAVVGQAGIGKSRLAWEFEKHLDGLVQGVYWHRGRCLAYGEAVAYNALAEMVRMRADIGDDEDPTTARNKLANTVERILPDPTEREFVLPRLGQLLGLEERAAPDQSDIFPAWRLFFDRLGDAQPVVLLFEDLQWADRGLLDFIDHLLDWSRDRPLLVIALARPEIADRADWSAQLRNLTTIRLEPLPDTMMDELLTGLVPGLPATIRGRIAAQAEGIPLYAVETVRMLLDRGSILPGEDGYVLAGDIEELEIPETLHALVAARLDGLEPEVRDLLDHAAVLGQSFGRETLRSVSELDDTALDEGLRALRARDLVAVDIEPQGAETGRYAFLQAIVRTVAYETLSRRERRRRHLRAARHLEATGAGDELADAAAAHYLDAYRSDPEAADAADVRDDALRLLQRAADRSESIAALEEAQRAYDAIAEISADPSARAGALLRAGSLAQRTGNTEASADRLREAARMFKEQGDTRQEALAEASLARIDFEVGRTHEAVERLGAAIERLDTDATRIEAARLGVEYARQLYFLARPDEAVEPLEAALATAERERLVDVVADGLNTKALILWNRGRPEESLALLRHANALGEDADTYTAFRAGSNLILFHYFRGQWEEGDEVARRRLAHARRQGDRPAEFMMLSRLVDSAIWTGRWDEARVLLRELDEIGVPTRHEMTAVDHARIRLLTLSGELDEARRLVEQQTAAGYVHEQERIIAANSRIALHRASGDHRRAVDDAIAVSEEPTTHGGLVLYLNSAVPSALALGEIETAIRLRDLAAELADPANVVSAVALELHDAQIAAARDEPETEALFRTAIAGYERIGLVVHRASAQIDLAEWLIRHDRREDAEPLLDGAEATLTVIGAYLELDRARALREQITSPVAPVESVSQA